MKIKWLIEEREVPGYGLFKPGEEYQRLPDEIAQEFVERNMAAVVVPIAKKPKEDKE